MLCLSGFELYSRWVLLMSKRAVSSFKFPHERGQFISSPFAGVGVYLHSAKMMTPMLHRELEYKVL